MHCVCVAAVLVCGFPCLSVSLSTRSCLPSACLHRPHLRLTTALIYGGEVHSSSQQINNQTNTNIWSQWRRHMLLMSPCSCHALCYTVPLFSHWERMLEQSRQIWFIHNKYNGSPHDVPSYRWLNLGQGSVRPCSLLCLFPTFSHIWCCLVLKLHSDLFCSILKAYRLFQYYLLLHNYLAMSHIFNPSYDCVLLCIPCSLFPPHSHPPSALVNIAGCVG